jgi:membrane protein YqaA with SNARE-associated domain
MVRSLAIFRWNALLPAMAAVALSAACLLVPIDPDLLERGGYAGVFTITLIATGALVLPVPYLAVIARVATELDPVAVAMVAGVAAALGELTGYVIGASGRDLVSGNRLLELTRQWMSRHGFATVAVASFIPNPAFDAVGALAGALGFRAWKFCAACFLGKTAKFLLVALAARGLAGF